MVPVKLLLEAQGHIIVAETKSASYRGTLEKSEANMNLSLTNVTITQKDGNVQKVEKALLRGSQIVFISLPEILAKAPVLNKV